MGVLTVRALEEILHDEIGDSLGTSIEALEIVNQAGQHLVDAHQWAWLEGRSVTLRPRAQIEIEDATWTEATNTITKVGAFADYGFLSADTAGVLGGTGATVGTYEVASNPTDDTITLTSSIGAAADGQTDIELLLPNDQILLPTDFDLASITAYSMANGLVGYPEFTNPQTMLNLRSYRGVGTTVGFWALLRHVRATTGGVPSPRLELWPRSDSNDEALVLFYRGGWIEPADDDDVLSIPKWLNGLMIELTKAVGWGHSEPESGSVSARVAEVLAGPLFRMAVARDAVQQPDHGPMAESWLEPTVVVGRYDVPPPRIET